MKDIETIIFSRMTGDTTLVSLIGAANRILHGFQNVTPHKPQITFYNIVSTKGILRGDQAETNELFYTFSIFAENYLDIVARLKRLFNGQVFEKPAGASEIQCIFSNWDFDGPDQYDDDLQVKRKDVRFKFTVTLQALDPIQ